MSRKDNVTMEMTEAFDWYILPSVNPDGYEYSRSEVSDDVIEHV